MLKQLVLVNLTIRGKVHIEIQAAKSSVRDQLHVLTIMFDQITDRSA